MKTLRAGWVLFAIVLATALSASGLTIPPLTDELTGQPIDEGTRNLVICIHGWNNPPLANRYQDTGEWSNLVSQLKPVLQSNTSDRWSLLLYRWEDEANTGGLGFPLVSINAVQAALNSATHGISLGPRLPASLRRVHFITHSAGVWCVYRAAYSLMQINPYVIVQITLLDPFMPNETPQFYGQYPDYSKAAISDMKNWSTSSQFYLLENYFADDSIPGVLDEIHSVWLPIFTVGTQESFSWRPGDVNLQVDWDPDFFTLGINRYYDWHSGPTLFYGDTIEDSIGGYTGLRLPPNGLPYSRNLNGWKNSLFYRTRGPLSELPLITTQPQKTTSVVSGASVTLSVQGSSVRQLSYQWFKRGQATAVFIGATYTFPASFAAAGDYVARVSDSSGMIFSDFAKITVTDAQPTPAAPAITSVSPSTLPPSSLTQLINIYGSNFKAAGDPNASTLIFRDPADNRYVRAPAFVSSSQLQYNILVQSAGGTWSVMVTNAGQAASNLKTFSVQTPPPNTGSLTVNLSPGGAVSAGAQWRVDGGSYRNSGDTATGLTPGSHSVSFKAVSGYDKPAEKLVSITSGVNATSTGSYSAVAPSTYSLSVNYDSGKGYVTKSPNQSTYTEGTVVRLSVSENTGFFFDHWSGNASGSADPLYITMNGNKSVTANFAVDTSMGHIRVDISPPQAAAEGAQWKYRNYTAWRASGNTQDFIPTGNGYVYFKDIPGWITPDQIQSPIVGGQTTAVNATYLEILGGVQVTLSPDQAGVAGARWRLDGGLWTESAVTLAGVPTGNHLIEFLPIPGWTAPSSQTVSVERGITATRSGVYGPPPGLPIITSVSPKTGPLTGGTTVTIDGVNFQTGATVSFGGVAATSVTVMGSTRITAVTPPRASYGSVALGLTSGGHTISVGNGYSYLNALGANIELVGQIGGNVEAVAVVGNLCYYGEGTSLVIADFANSAAPVERGRIALPEIVRGLAVSGNTVFVANSYAGLYAVDVSSPTTPSIVGFFDTDSAAQGVAVDGSIAYVADAASGLVILNVGNPAAIVRLGGIDTAGSASQVAVGTIGVDKYAFVAESDSALRVIKVTVPSSPIEITNVPGQSSAGIKDVKLVGTTLYVSDWQAGVKIFDSSNPASPVQTGSRGNVGPSFIDVVGNRLYTCGSGLRIADLSVMPIPPSLGDFDVGNFCYDLVVANGLAFAAMGDAGLRVVSVSNSASMSLRSAIQTIGGVEDVWVSGGVAYVGNGSGLHTLDVSNPARPVRLATLPGERVTDIVVAAGKATLVNYGDETVRIVNVANPSTPSLLGTYTNLEVWNVALKGNTPVLAAATRDAAHKPKMDILNLSSPSNPQSSASLLLDGANGIAAAVAIAGDWAFVGRQGWAGNPSNALDVISLSNPGSPQRTGSLPLGSDFFRNIAVSTNGNFVYLPLASGFQVIDVTAKASPVLGQVVDPPQTFGSVDSIEVSGSRLFLDEGGFIFVFDLTVPSSPVLVGYYDIPNVAYGIAVDSDLIFVAGANAGVSVFRLNDVNNPTLSIISPTANPHIQTNGSPVALIGVASDNQAVTRVVWENNRGGSGEAQGTTSWSISGVPLAPGLNVITVTAFDGAGLSGSDSLSVTYDVPKQNQIVTFPPPVDGAFGDMPITLAATASSGLSVSYSVLFGPATLSSNVLTLTGAGSVGIRAAQTGDATFNAAVPVDRSITVAKGEQVITFAALPDKVLSDAPFTLTATSSSGLPVALSVVSGPATLAGNLLRITGAGTVTVRASQAGSSTFNAAPEVDRSFEATKTPQFITFGALSRQVFGDAPFVLSAAVSSGLPVTFSVLSGPAVLSGDILTMTGAGLVVLRASQSGDAIYAPAPNADQVLIVAPGSNVITDFMRLANGMFTLRYYGETGTNYIVKASTNLVNWLPVATNQISGLGYLEFTDTTSTNYDRRFYQIAP